MSYKEIVLVTFCLCSTFAAPPAIKKGVLDPPNHSSLSEISAVYENKDQQLKKHQIQEQLSSESQKQEEKRLWSLFKKHLQKLRKGNSSHQFQIQVQAQLGGVSHQAQAQVQSQHIQGNHQVQAQAQAQLQHGQVSHQAQAQAQLQHGQGSHQSQAQVQVEHGQGNHQSQAQVQTQHGQGNSQSQTQVQTQHGPGGMTQSQSQAQIQGGNGSGHSSQQQFQVHLGGAEHGFGFQINAQHQHSRWRKRGGKNQGQMLKRGEQRTKKQTRGQTQKGYRSYQARAQQVKTRHGEWQNLHQIRSRHGDGFHAFRVEK